MFGRFEHERYPTPGEKSKRTGPVKSITTRAQTSSSLLRSDEKLHQALNTGTQKTASGTKYPTPRCHQDTKTSLVLFVLAKAVMWANLEGLLVHWRPKNCLCLALSNLPNQMVPAP